MNETQKKLLLVGLMLGVMLEGLDGTILSTAMPRIVSDLNGLSLISWVFTTYMLTSVIMTPIYGKLSDLYGRKFFYVGGMTLFMAASILAGQAQSVEWLIFWRGVQGLGAGAMMPIAHAIGFDVFKGPEIGRIQGFIGAGFGVSSLVGPFLGGWLTDGPGWRWAFYLNLPLGLIVIGLMLMVQLPATTGSRGRAGKPRIDYAGTVTLMLFTLSLLLGFVFGGDATLGWTNPQTLAMFGVALVSLFGFIRAEQKAADPILPLWFFKHRTFVVLSLAGFLVGAVMYGALNYTAFYIQGVQANSAASSGTAITPLMLSLIFGVVFGGNAVAHLGKYRGLATAAMLIMALGGLQLFWLDLNSGTPQVLLAMGTMGFGIGISFPIFVIALQNAFDESFIGSLTSLNDFFRLIGGTVGTSILGSVLTASLTNQVPQRLKASLGESAYAALPGKGITPDAQLLTSSQGLEMLKSNLANEPFYNTLVMGLREALATSLHLVFVMMLVAAVAAVLVILFLKERPLRWSLRRGGLHGGHSQEGAEAEAAHAPTPEPVLQ